MVSTKRDLLFIWESSKGFKKREEGSHAYIYKGDFYGSKTEEHITVTFLKVYKDSYLDYSSST